MNLLWVAAITLLVLAEMATVYGHSLRRLSAGLLIATGLALPVI